MTLPTSAADHLPALHLLQGMLWPEPGISSEPTLYVRLSGPAGLGASRRRIQVGAGAELGFDTAFNLFNLGKWQHGAGLSDLSLSLRGQGEFALVVRQHAPRRSDETILSEIVTLTEGQPLIVDLTGHIQHALGGVLTFALTSFGTGHLDDIAWLTRQAPRRQPQIALSITTFRREEAVQASVRRFRDYVATSPLAAHLHLQVVDNGQSAGIEPCAHVTPIPNENLGGAGGFARGLIEAEARGATHVLFMDDDASVHMDALQRTWAWLAHASDDNAAVAGALTNAQFKHLIWENGARFHIQCRPESMGTDLRDFDEAAAMEFASTGGKPGNYYGGWWYFAFPIAATRFRPFPYFVRGDDVGFSLANDFSITTLPGVVSFQDANFADKESLNTLYLDLRSHMANHIAIPGVEIPRTTLASIPLRFFGRSLLQCHYETMEALNLSFEDVMRGPDFFEENADMAARRADLARIRDVETFRPLAGPPPADHIRWNPANPVVRLVMKLTLNGHLIPFWRRIGNRRVLPAGRRGEIRQTWAAAQVTYLDGKGNAFTVHHSKRKAARQLWRMTRNMWHLWRHHDAIRADWREGYLRLASDAFWRRRLGLDPAPAPVDRVAVQPADQPVAKAG